MTKAGYVLVVDDEPMMREAVACFLRKQGHRVLTADCGREALRLIEKEPVVFVILDLILPDISGEEVCAAIRKRSRVPIIILTAKTNDENMVNGLDLGADDYITKPFSLKNLCARMTAVARRSSADMKALAQNFSWNHGDLVIRSDRQEVFKKGVKISLTPSEWKILSAFITYPQHVFSRDDLLNICFDHAFEGYDRIIDTHVKNLRRKIEDDPRNPVYIRTVYGMGYRFSGEGLF